jgi:hypothetical protein
MPGGGVLASGKDYQSQQAGLRRTFTDLLSTPPVNIQFFTGYRNLAKNASYIF